MRRLISTFVRVKPLYIFDAFPRGIGLSVGLSQVTPFTYMHIVILIHCYDADYRFLQVKMKA